ncbi:hypothetical protein FGO68_gene7885 [Halteria grandinella]|uniref:Uncharacterized protein n=1 Tax=Halteria grandinella TaxID=5974 RepID=A0A8J8N9P6_HALGN|nr:hypothetical protein FGO68_gene7885 [Halteria grandinella]
MRIKLSEDLGTIIAVFSLKPMQFKITLQPARIAIAEISANLGQRISQQTTNRTLIINMAGQARPKKEIIHKEAGSEQDARQLISKEMTAKILAIRTNLLNR